MRPQTPQRILVIRLDRIGDVVLSTPVLRALRDAYPSAFIAMMVRPACRELLEGHPCLNAVILYDKDGRHRGIGSTIRFARDLRRFRFDTVLVLHPSRRSHWIPWLAGIPARIGWNRKSGWLLTRRVPHRKQEGAKHEAAYTLDLLRELGLTPPAPAPSIALHPDAARRIDALLREAALSTEQGGGPLVAIHPSASCRSKRWLPERFAHVADRLVELRQARIVLVAGEADAPHADAVARAMRHRSLNLAGRLSLGELACLLRRCTVLISNDSGPVHVAAAVGTPVVALFGRNQRGLSPARWGPVGPRHVVLQKEVGCRVCLAHKCDIDFLCLSSIATEEVLGAVLPFLVDAPTVR